MGYTPVPVPSLFPQPLPHLPLPSALQGGRAAAPSPFNQPWTPSLGPVSWPGVHWPSGASPTPRGASVLHPPVEADSCAMTLWPLSPYPPAICSAVVDSHTKAHLLTRQGQTPSQTPHPPLLGASTLACLWWCLDISGSALPMITCCVALGKLLPLSGLQFPQPQQSEAGQQGFKDYSRPGQGHQMGWVVKLNQTQHVTCLA